MEQRKLKEETTYHIGNIMGDNELPKGSCTFGMDNTLGDSFSVEVGQQIDEMEVLKQDGTIVPDCLRCRGKGHWTTVGGCVNWSCSGGHCIASVMLMKIKSNRVKVSDVSV